MNAILKTLFMTGLVGAAVSCGSAPESTGDDVRTSVERPAF